MKTFSKSELLLKGGIEDSISQIRLVHDLDTYLLCQVFIGSEKKGFTFLREYTYNKK